jgi:hypothetical protein
MVVFNIVFPRFFSYGFASPLMGFITGTTLVCLGGLLNIVPFTLISWAILTTVSTLLWVWGFYSLRN